MGDVAGRIRQKLEAAFSPSVLEVRDDSAKHRGHVGARPEGETHFHLTIQADSLRGLGRVARHRKIYAVLSGELADAVHALSIEVRDDDKPDP